MLHKAKFAVCSETHTKNTNFMWSQRRIFECQTLSYVKLPVGFKRLMRPSESKGWNDEWTMNCRGCRRKCSGQIWINVQEYDCWKRKKKKTHEAELPALVPKFGLMPFCLRSTIVTALSVLLVKECRNLKPKLRRRRFDYNEGSSRPNVLICFVSTLNS
jgi:hypothetical protein